MSSYANQASYRSVYRSPSVAATSLTSPERLGTNTLPQSRATYNNVSNQKAVQGRASASANTTRQPFNSYINTNTKKGLDMHEVLGNNGVNKRSLSPTNVTAVPDNIDRNESTPMNNVYARDDDASSVRLWRITKDGNSPQASRYTHSILEKKGNSNNDSPRMDNSTPSRPTPSADCTFGTSLEFGKTNGSTASLVNMSLDSALMGGLGGRVGEIDARTTSTPLKLFNTTVGSPTRAANSNNRCTQNSSSLISSFYSNSHNSISRVAFGNQNHLVPQLQLPTYERQITRKYIGANGVVSSTTEIQSYYPSWITVVFDLDETLCNNRRPGRALLRPGCMEILKSLAAIRDDVERNCYIELILWTASIECVARPVIDRLDPHNTIFDHLIFRDRRWYKEMRYTKDLRLLGRDMSHVVIIENSPQSVILNRRHAILVKDFVGGCGVRGPFSGYLANSVVSTNSSNDPSLFIVLQVLVDWATEVGKQGMKQLDAQLEDMKWQCKSHVSPVFVSLPGNLGVVEYLRENRNINAENEVILNASNRHFGTTGGTSPLQDKGSFSTSSYPFNKPNRLHQDCLSTFPHRL